MDLIYTYSSLIKTIRNMLFDKQSNVSLSESIKFVNGYSFDPKEYVSNGKYFVCTITNVTGERYINTSIVNYIADMPHDLNNNQILADGDLVMSLTGNVGRVSMVQNTNGLLNQRVAKIIPNDKEQKYFLYHTLSSDVFLNFAVKNSQGSSQNNIYFKTVENFKLPSYQENKNLVNLLDNIDMIVINEKAIQDNLFTLKTSLLKSLFI